MTDNTNIAEDILDEIIKRHGVHVPKKKNDDLYIFDNNMSTSTSDNVTPVQVLDSKSLNEALEYFKQKLGKKQETTEKKNDPVEAYDRAMKGIL